ncbi:hypothetical protein [uncultured Gemmiger sp.]|uniref:hypothetical protein n=1 Tax=uncultured Gemmiger sp. TaxID=1623490 RepID=UPI0025E96D44|nr:hypothetical protein [uncultured Gemmiger sp.]
MRNKTEMNHRNNASDVDMNLLMAGIGEMLDGIRHCLKATDAEDDEQDDGYLFMAAAYPGKGIQVRDVTECYGVLKCFGTEDSVMQAPDCDMLMSYDERQVLVLDGWKYLIGPAIFYNVDGDGEDVSLTTEEIYEVQRMVDHRTVTLWADGREFPAILLNKVA